jgi:carboxypeptidase PM20D1
MAHIDVVPAEGGPQWSCDPWAGEIREGAVWGRGALDDKGVLVCLLEAMDVLLERGIVPGRSVVLAFGEDEEIGGDAGAAKLSAELARRGWSFDFCLDEGGLVLDKAVGFLRQSAALIGISEKGHVNFNITAHGHSGHASTPPVHQAAVDLARGIDRLSKRPFPSRLSPVSRSFLITLGQSVRGPLGFLLRHPGFSWPLLAGTLGAQAKTAAMIRTTMAFTMLEAAPKANVLPEQATANVNVRLLPGDTIEYANRRLETIVKPLGLDVALNQGESINEALPVSPTTGPDWDELAGLCARYFPNAVVLPYLCLAGTDTRHYASVCRAIYRFSPFAITQKILDTVHSADERLPLDAMSVAIEYYLSLMAGETRSGDKNE